MQTKQKHISFIVLLILGFIWGTGYSIAHFATTHGVTPLGYSFWQSIGPALVISFIILFTQETPIPLSKAHLRYYFICGLTGIVIPNTNMYFAAPQLPAGLLAVIVNTVPLIAYPLAILSKTETFHPTRLLGVISAVLGIMCIILPTHHTGTVFNIPWAFVALLTPLSFAFCSVYISRYRPKVGGSLSLAAGTLIMSSLLLTPFVFAKSDFYYPHLPFSHADLVIFLEIILSSIGYILFFKLIQIAGPVYYSLVDSIVALTGLFWGYFLFHEHLTHWTLPAVCLILLGLNLVTKRPAVLNYSLPSPHLSKAS